MPWIYGDNGSTFLDDATRTATIYDEGGEQISTRPYTAEEIARADAEAAAVVEDSNRRTIAEMLAADFATVQTILADTNANINDNPAARIKAGFRVLRRLVRVANGDFSGTD